jgi:LysM repeat protein
VRKSGANSKIRKRGRHRRPSQVQKAAQRAGRAAPTLAVAGAIAASPQALAAPLAIQAAPSVRGGDAITAHLDAALRPAAPAERTYTVVPGDTLSGIAQSFYGAASDWHWLYWVNRASVSNPNLITVGQVLTVPADPPASVTNGTFRPRHAKASSATSTSSSPSTSTAADPPGSSSGPGTAAATQSQSSSDGSSASLSSSVQQDIANGNNLLAVAQYLVENGYSDAGVASCVYGESAGDPESVGSGGGGLIGWTPIGSAAPNTDIITGDAAQDMMTQLADILYYNSTEIGQSLVAQLNSISDPVAAADFYSQNFEKPYVTDSDVVPSVAEQVLSELGGLWPPRPRQRPAGRDHVPGYPAAQGMSRGSPFVIGSARPAGRRAWPCPRR